ncbi:Right handed beta helix region [Micromonospora nigra]|uniref:Right handed beta helix region n=1 Tax=Micromonospora nigra TaxID=145857 RepID=A0A1C6T130_9ACTN|nr:hypothetical protein [Micromonospora nigra]SCL35243.1 Right handed beta helix region [Micromonospora nigra]
MSMYPGNRRAAPRRRSRWLPTGALVAGSLVAGSLMGGAAGPTGVATARDLPFSTADWPAAAGRDGGPADDHHGQPDRRAGAGDGKRGDGHRDEGRTLLVPCDEARLIAALVRANAEGGATLRLAPECTYTLTHAFQQVDEYDGGLRDAREAADTAENPGDAEAAPRRPEDDTAGLPVIYQPIVVEGAGATIVRDVHAENFRFFTVRDGGELTLRDVTLRNGRSAAEGGSIHVVHGATAVVERTTILGSTSLSAEGGGGGIFNDGNLVADGVTFIGNRAAGPAGKGGGLLNGGVLTLRNADFRHNNAALYGGGLANFRAASEVTSSRFARNTAAQGGGLANFSARMKANGLELTANTAEVGGGLANSDAVLVARGMAIRDNTATGKGGGISTFQGLLPLDDSVVAGNVTRGQGGGIHAEKSNLLVRTSNVEGNEAAGSRSQGAGVHVTSGTASFYRSTVVGNAATGKPGGIFADRARVKVDDETVIVKNSPSNCEGSRIPVPHCFR